MEIDHFTRINIIVDIRNEIWSNLKNCVDPHVWSSVHANVMNNVIVNPIEVNPTITYISTHCKQSVINSLSD